MARFIDKHVNGSLIVLNSQCFCFSEKKIVEEIPEEAAREDVVDASIPGIYFCSFYIIYHNRFCPYCSLRICEQCRFTLIS
jgi:hypothetical protein